MVPPKRSHSPASFSQVDVDVNSLFFFLQSFSFSSQVEESRIRVVDYHGPTMDIRLPPGLRPAQLINKVHVCSFLIKVSFFEVQVYLLPSSFSSKKTVTFTCPSSKVPKLKLV